MKQTDYLLPQARAPVSISGVPVVQPTEVSHLAPGEEPMEINKAGARSKRDTRMSQFHLALTTYKESQSAIVERAAFAHIKQR